jgi:AbrB family looped-hinge helix DNA binding protein
MYSVMMGKRGTVVIPAKLRKRFNLQEGSALLLEERKEGILMRPAITTPVDVEIYTPERLAEFFSEQCDGQGRLSGGTQRCGEDGH